MSYIVPQKILPSSSNLEMSALYGLGIGRAIVQNAVAQSINKNYYNIKIDPESPYAPDAEKNSTNGYTKNPDSYWDGYMSSSLVGMPVMCYLKLQGGKYRSIQGDEFNIPDIIFETVVITVNMTKDIVKTSILGRETGSVKEYIGLGDWDIDVRAIVTSDAPLNETIDKKNQDGVYPRDNMSELWRVLRAPIAIPVECWFLNMYDINHIVIESFDISQVEGEYSMQRFTMNCVSDNPLIIKVYQ